MRLENTQTHPLARVSTIGLFDSGVGGLSVLRQLKALAPQTFYYLADTARCPYGNREPGEIRNFVREIVSWLVNKGCEAIVIACNTSTANAQDVARLISPVPVFDLIGVTANYAASLNKRIGVFATAATVKSQAFSRAIHAIDPDSAVIEIACPEFVPIVENGLIDSSSTHEIVKAYIDKIQSEGVDALILGCTHFPFLSGLMREIAGPDLQLIDPAEILLKEILASQQMDIAAQNHRQQQQEQISQAESATRSLLYTTGSPSKFNEAATACLGYYPGSVKRVSLSELSTSITIAEMPEGIPSGLSSNMVPAQ